MQARNVLDRKLTVVLKMREKVCLIRILIWT